MNAKTISSAIAGLVLLAFTSNAWALPIYFSDRALFEAAAGGALSIEDFEAEFGVASSVAFADFTVSETDGTNALGQLRDFPSLGVNAAITTGTGGIVYDDNGGSIGSFFDFSSLIQAFGIDLATSQASTVTVGGSAMTSFATGAGTHSFFGVIDLAGLTSLSFDISGGPNVGFDTATYGLVSVTEPGTLALLGLGLLAIGAARRRKV